MSLNKYHEKRNFKKTREPKGKMVSSTSRRLYVIQKHAASHLHYDFRLELNGVLLSWAVPKGPCLDPSVKRLAVHVEDHPIDYGSLEGEIPKGEYGGGTVILWDTGEWQCDDPNSAYKKGDLTFVLHGKKLKGGWKLIRIKNDPKNWLLMKLDDRYAKPLSDYDVLLKMSKSVKSKKTIEQFTKDHAQPIRKKTSKKKACENWEIVTPIKPLPAIVQPELATLVNAPPEGNQWLHEIKFDGYRLLAYIDNHNEIRLITRGQQDWTTKFRNIVKAIKKLGLSNTILDGEVVVLDKQQHANFQLLQNSLQSNQQNNFIYYAFDLIYYDSHDLTQLPLFERKKLLSTIITSTQKGILRYSDHVEGSGKSVFEKSCELALEGIISKRKNSPYREKRTQDWVKVKCLQRQEFIVVGFTKPQGVRQYFGSLLLAIWRNKKLIYCGHVGTGFNQTSLREINKELKKRITTIMPLSKRPPDSKLVTWIQPTLVVEVEFSEWTQDGILRHPSFKGIRHDKSATEIQQEIPKKITEIKSTLALTHPEKILYPKSNITKSDLYEYYKKIQDWILPYIIERPLTLLRSPDHHKHFYQKHMNASMPSTLQTIAIDKKIISILIIVKVY